MKKIAVIGSGISGISAAHYLDKDFDVTLFESNDRLGGHTHTVNCTLPDNPSLNVDCGFIVFNKKNYPRFKGFLDELSVVYHHSDMSFSFYEVAKNHVWTSDFPFGTFANYRSFFDLAFWRFLLEINSFNQNIKQALLSNQIDHHLSLKDYLETLPYSKKLFHDYVYPMGAAIWSCGKDEILNYPARSFFSFWQNHHLLNLRDRHQWLTIQNGSQSYIDAFERSFAGTILRETPVISIESSLKGVTLCTENSHFNFDLAVLACHADQSQQLLKFGFHEQLEALKPWAYQKNDIYLHYDQDIIACPKKYWTSWQVDQQPNGSYDLHYYMNRLQNLETAYDIFVSLNPSQVPKNHKTLKILHFDHPIFTSDALHSQSLIKALNGMDRLFFCGSYLGYGFHEDGFQSGFEAATAIKKSQWLLS